MAGAYGKAGKHLALARRCVLDGRLTHPPDGKRRGAGGGGAGCRKSGLRHFFEVFIAPLRLRRGQGAMQGNPCYARLFADLTRMSPNPIKASGGCGPRTPGGFSTGCKGGGLRPPPLCALRAPAAPPLGWDEQLPPGKGRRGRAGDMRLRVGARPLGPWRRVSQGGGSPRPSGGAAVSARLRRAETKAPAAMAAGAKKGFALPPPPPGEGRG